MHILCTFIEYQPICKELAKKNLRSKKGKKKILTIDNDKGWRNDVTLTSWDGFWFWPGPRPLWSQPFC